MQARDKRLLADLYLQRVMSRDQIIDLGYFDSVPRCNNRLKKLLDHGYVRRYRHVSRGSGSQALYTLGKESAQIVAERLDVDQDDVLGFAQREIPSLFLEHTLGLVDLRIFFERDDRLLQLEDFEWLPETLCRHEYSVRNAGGFWQKQVLKPDVFTCWLEQGRKRSFFIELDLGHVSFDAFRRKVVSYQRYLSLGVFTEAYGSDSFDVLVVTTGERRISHLQKAANGFEPPHFLFTTLSDLKDSGPLSAIWVGTEGHSLHGGNI